MTYRVLYAVLSDQAENPSFAPKTDNVRWGLVSPHFKRWKTPLIFTAMSRLHAVAALTSSFRWPGWCHWENPA